MKKYNNIFRILYNIELISNADLGKWVQRMFINIKYMINCVARKYSYVTRL